MSETRNLGGRPRKYESPEAFDAMVDAYRDECREEKEPMTWTGLALHLGFSSRQSIDEYLNYDGFSDSVKRAKLLVEWSYEKRLLGNNAAGPIFVLKNMGWSDKQEIEQTSTVTNKPAIDYSKLSKETLEELRAQLGNEL